MLFVYSFGGNGGAVGFARRASWLSLQYNEEGGREEHIKFVTVSKTDLTSRMQSVRRSMRIEFASQNTLFLCGERNG